MRIFEENFFESKSAKIPEPEIQPERKEEKDYYAMLREDLRNMKRGGVDIHFSEIDIDNLSTRALELYRKHKKGTLSEKEIEEFNKTTAEGSDDYSFTAMLLHWHLDRILIAREEEKKLLRESAERKFQELQKKNPHIAAYAEGISWSNLGKNDYEIMVNLNEQNFLNYEKRLKECFRNLAGNKKLAVTEVENNSRFRYYCVLREVMEKGSISPENFMNNL